MATPSDDVTFTTRDVKVSGWEGVRITRGIERCPSTFEIEMTERYPGETDAVIVKPGDPCSVAIGGDTVTTGYVDHYSIGIAGSRHTIRCAGRSKCQDLVDCSADIANGQLARSTVLALAQQLAAKYGITVTCLGDPGPVVPVFNVTYGETCWEIIERVARYAQLLAYDDENGNLVLAQAGSQTMASGFKQGVNVEAAEVAYTMDQRFSDYVVYALAMNTIAEFGALAPLARVKDSGVPRFREHVIIASQGPGIALAQKRAQWEMTRRWGRSQQINVTCDAWRDSAGKLWQPNALAPIDIPAARMTGLEFTIGEVSYVRDKRGTHAELLLMPREAFLPEPITLQPWLPEFAYGSDSPSSPPTSAIGPAGPRNSPSPNTNPVPSNSVLPPALWTSGQAPKS